MYCTCSNKNNYEVISLCDIKKFSDKNGPFNNKAWVQISIADILILDCNKPNIEKIEKIYVTINITSSKIIATPLSIAPNSDGMLLSGKKLLIDGFICSKIVYTSLTREQFVYSSDFTIPFCTYIVLERNTDIFNDKYCIKTCIEDVFLSLVDCKTIFQNITLFLLAEKTSLTCPNPQPPKENCTINNINPPNPSPPNVLPNYIIVNDLTNNAVITLSFDKVDMKILVTSTGNKTDINGGTNYFKFTLYQSDGTTEKITDTIGGNENGMNFSNNISNKDFQFNDIITLQYDPNAKVIITNFPDTSTPIYNVTGTEERFKLTQNGLIAIPATIPNEISVVDAGNVLSKISFDAINNKILATSTDKQINITDNEALVLFKLRDKNDINIIKVHSLIASNTIATNFTTQLNNSDFKLGDIIEIQIRFPRLVNITNFVSPGNTYIMANQQSADRPFTEFFTITSTGLQSTVPATTPSIPQLPNIITVKFNNTKLLAFSLYFNTLDKILGFNFKNTTFRTHYVTLVLKDTNGNLIKRTEVDGGIPTTINPLFNLFFEYGYILEIINTNESKGNIEISNFPTTGQTHISSVDKESFRITQNGLEAIAPPSTLLQNEILITKPDNTEVAKIGFDVTNNKFLVTSTGEEISNPDNRAMILLYLRDGSTGNIKYHSSIISNEDASQFVTDLNEKDFALNDFIELNVYSVGTAKISSFPNQGDTHTINTTTNTTKTSQEFFKITSTRIELLTSQDLPKPLPSPSRFPQNIIYILSSGTSIFTIYFNILERVLIGTRSPANFESGYLKIKLSDSKGNTIFEKTKDSTVTTTDFIYAISNVKFDNNQILQLNYDDSSRGEIYINNFPTQGNTHRPTTNEEFYKITPTGLKSYFTPTFLKNNIIVNKRDGSTYGTIAFDIANKELSLTDFNSEYSSSGDNYPILNFRLYAANNSRTKDITLNSTSDGTAFFNNLNKAKFDINSVLELAYDDRSKNSINITNFPDDGTTHTPSVTREYYKITTDGLVVHNPLPHTINYLKADGSVSFYFTFDIIEKKVKWKILNRNPSVDTSSFLLKLNGNLSAELSRVDTDVALYVLGGIFDYGNSDVELTTNGNPIQITNYPTIGTDTIIPNSPHVYYLTINGIKQS